MLNIPAKYEILGLAKFLLASLLGVSAGVCQRALMDESGMIRTHMGTHNSSENGRNS
jgi:hypothetical protein